MKKLLRNFKYAAGFTLIELLVVIGILGILASALVATIDPFEQLNKAHDSNLKNTSVEFLNSNIRYFTTHNALPWDNAADGGAGCYATADLSPVALSDFDTCIATLISEGELKQGFTTFNGLDEIFVTESDNDIAVCYSPVSKSQQTDPATRYAQDGTTGIDCKSSGGNTNCYWCAQ